jgi:hypothetical protein
VVDVGVCADVRVVTVRSPWALANRTGRVVEVFARQAVTGSSSLSGFSEARVLRPSEELSLPLLPLSAGHAWRISLRCASVTALCRTRQCSMPHPLLPYVTPVTVPLSLPPCPNSIRPAGGGHHWTPVLELPSTPFDPEWRAGSTCSVKAATARALLPTLADDSLLLSFEMNAQPVAAAVSILPPLLVQSALCRPVELTVATWAAAQRAAAAGASAAAPPTCCVLQQVHFSSFCNHARCPHPLTFLIIVLLTPPP